ncbi:MAG TPA: FAD-dependent oxidoreductase [Gemmatimonadaceae bacterium]|nr:FAD-dependent oxidoreductase [Gemmatimonadaceae bacterium]
MDQVSDLIIVGGGAVGLASALAASDRGLDVLLITEHRPGQASWAAAGMLAPSIEEFGSREAETFATAARDRFPSYLAALQDRTGITVPLNRTGILVIGAPSPRSTPQHLTKPELAKLEPALRDSEEAWFYPHDGAVDNVKLLDALEAALAHSPRVHRVTGPVRSLRVDRDAVTCDMGKAPQLLLAAGAWTSLIEGLPRPLPIHPMRGQMLSLAAAPLTHVVYGPQGYLVPRGGTHTLAGSTMERSGFDASTTDHAIAEIRAMANTLCPSLTTASTAAVWAGLRPVTPDFLPIIGHDPDYPSLLYACGHSRNGVLLAPLTADCVAALAVGEPSPFSLSPFTVDRFAVTSEAV